MAGKNSGEIAEILAIPLALEQCQNEVVLADKYVFKKKDKNTFEFRNKEFKNLELQNHCDKIITNTKKGTKKGVVKDDAEYKKTLEFLGITN